MSEQDPTQSGPTSPEAGQPSNQTPVTYPVDAQTPGADAQPGYPQPGYPQPGYPTAGYPQAGYPQPAYGQPGYPQPGYPQPPYGAPGAYAAGGYAYAPVPANNTLALVSLILGIAGLFVIPFVGSIGAVITGHMGRKQIRERGEGGDGMAIGGLITGYLGIAIYLLLGVFLLLIPLMFVAASSTTVS